MSYPHVHYDLSHLYRHPSLRADGSNFKEWYQDLRNVLRLNKILYVIEEPLGDKPRASASQEEDDAYRVCRDTFITIQCTMTSCMAPELRSRFEDLEPYDMADELKAVFIEKVRLMKFKCLDIFFQLRWKKTPA